MSKGDPIPAKFDPPEEDLIRELARATGLTVSEVIRRAARLLRIEIARRGQDWHTFLIRDLGPDYRPPVDAARQEDDAAVKPYGDKKIVAIPEKRAATRKVSYSSPKKQVRR
jgi:hypothetical protein